MTPLPSANNSSGHPGSLTSMQLKGAKFGEAAGDSTSDVPKKLPVDGATEGGEATIHSTADATEEGGNAINITADTGRTVQNEKSQPNDDEYSFDLGEISEVPKLLAESEITFASRLSYDELFRAYVKKMARSGVSEKPKGPKLVKSFVEYVENLEARVKHIEEQLDIESAEAQATSGPHDSRQDLKFEIKFYDTSTELGSSGQFAADSDSKVNTFRSTVDSRNFLRVAYTWKGNSSDTTGTQEQGNPNPADIEIFALRIDSTPIADFLEELCGTDGRGCVIELIGPFRILIRHRSEIQDKLQKLQAHLDSEESSQGTVSENRTMSQNDVGPPSSNSLDKKFNDGLVKSDSEVKVSPTPDESNAKKTQESVEHFRQLLDFMDTYMATDLKLYRDLQAAEVMNISFDNLWMLFDNQETIYSPSKKGNQSVFNTVTGDTIFMESKDTAQAYRVLGTSGGIPVWTGTASDESSESSTTMKLAKFFEDTKASAGVAQLMGQRGNLTPLLVYCFCIEYDGKDYFPVGDFFSFKPFKGDVVITSLEAYPVRFRYLATASDVPSRDYDLIERGRKFISMTAVRHMDHEGLAVGKNKEEISSPVIVDMKLSFQENEDTAPKPTALTEIWPGRELSQVMEIVAASCNHIKPNSPCHKWKCMVDAYPQYQKRQISIMVPSLMRQLEASEADVESEDKLNEFTKYMEDARLIQLLPGVVHGFALRNRKWVQMDLDCLGPVKQDAGWTNLVLPRGHKKIVQAMVENHAAGTRLQGKSGQRQQKLETDLVRGKGKGCIILIHGAPGVGKTSTAECVAAHTKRPLFPITCGDIGYKPDDVEGKMDKLFNLAHKWGCVLLLDEADVFLAKRTKDDVKRNGLVSVFLRILEYYSGIFFLTTNRVGDIDDAFRSRLHLTLFYPRLGFEQSRKVFKMNMKRVQELSAERVRYGQPEIDIDTEKVLKFAKDNFKALQWNGRQIRNAWQTALALAEFDQKDSKKPPRLSAKHFRIISGASRQFDDYLRRTRGFTEDKQAQRDLLRVEEFDVTLVRDIEEASSDEDDDSEDLFSDSDTDGLNSEDEKAARKKSKKKEGDRSKSRSSMKSKNSKHTKEGAKSKRQKRGKSRKQDSDEKGSDDEEESSDE